MHVFCVPDLKPSPRNGTREPTNRHFCWFCFIPDSTGSTFFTVCSRLAVQAWSHSSLICPSHGSSVPDWLRLCSSSRNQLLFRGAGGAHSAIGVFPVAGPSVWNSLPDNFHKPTLSADGFLYCWKIFLFEAYLGIQRISGPALYAMTSPL